MSPEERHLCFIEWIPFVLGDRMKMRTIRWTNIKKCKIARETDLEIVFAENDFVDLTLFFSQAYMEETIFACIGGHIP